MRNDRRSARRLMNEINVVPYIDVMLVLLVIFMVTAPLMNPGQVDLPSVGKSLAPPVAPLEVIINKDNSLALRDHAKSGKESKVSYDELIAILKNISQIPGPILLHVVTKKGKGYAIAESNPAKWHASTPFDVATGKPKKISTQKTYMQVFGETAVELASKNPKVIAITAAMCEGTGLVEFAQKFPDRFFDVGIAEEHGVSFAAGLAKSGIRPLVAIYSTFLQRAHDQIIHDVALQNLPVIFCLDRAGLVGEDGPTHHGVFDIAYLRKIPGMTVMAPRDGRELQKMLKFAVDYKEGPIAMRYPRGAVAEESGLALKETALIEKGKAEILRNGHDVLILALGSMVYTAFEAAVLLSKQGIEATVVNARFAKPLDEELIFRLANEISNVVTIEEGALAGGFGSAVLEFFERKRADFQTFPNVRTLGIPDQFIEHGKRENLPRSWKDAQVFDPHITLGEVDMDVQQPDLAEVQKNIKNLKGAKITISSFGAALYGKQNSEEGFKMIAKVIIPFQG